MKGSGLNETQMNTVSSAIISWKSGNKTYIFCYLIQGSENYRVLMNILCKDLRSLRSAKSTKLLPWNRPILCLAKTGHIPAHFHSHYRNKVNLLQSSAKLLQIW